MENFAYGAVLNIKASMSPRLASPRAVDKAGQGRDKNNKQDVLSMTPLTSWKLHQ